MLAEPRSRSWRATLDGQRLERATAYGWAQAWWLPSNGGRLVVGHVGGHRHTLVVLEGVLVLLALLLCAAQPREAAVTRSRGWLVAAVVFIAAVAVAGALVTPTGRVARAARGGVAPVVTSQLVCPSLYGGPGGRTTDMTVAHVTSGQAPKAAYTQEFKDIKPRHPVPLKLTDRSS